MTSSKAPSSSPIPLTNMILTTARGGFCCIRRDWRRWNGLWEPTPPAAQWFIHGMSYVQEQRPHQSPQSLLIPKNHSAIQSCPEREWCSRAGALPSAVSPRTLWHIRYFILNTNWIENVFYRCLGSLLVSWEWRLKMSYAKPSAGLPFDSWQTAKQKY